MENRKSLKFLFPILVLGFFIFGNNAYAYNVPTHEFLTKSIAEFYNKNFPKKAIPKEIINYLIDGSGQEDNVPRYFNHFYDPVNNTGLHDKIYRGMASKTWAQNEEAQLALIYRILPHTEASILTAAEIQKIQPEFGQSDFTWQKAIDLYAKGEKEEAFFALGHILHLIEDASVPDHTRNDSHPPFDDGGSPYENWTAKFTLENPDQELASRLKNKKPILTDDIGSYFDATANYSNNNFYSKDSIKNYELPKPDYIEKGDLFAYAVKKDADGIYRLSIVKNYGNQYEWKNDELLLPHSAKNFIMPDYWSRLSVKAVQYGAGIVDRFFKEGEAAREKYLTEKAQRPYLATLIDGVSSIFGGGAVHDVGDTVNGFKLVSEVPIAKSEQEKTQPLPRGVVPVDEAKSKSKIETEIVALNLQSVEPVLAKPVEETKTCSFSTTQSPSHSGVIINEVAWMGSANSSNDEWIELKNISASDIDLSDWQLVDLKEEIKVRLSGKLSAGSFYLLERTDDSSVPSISADQIYTGALANVGEGLRLFDKNCGLVDEVMAAPDWPAGDNNFKYTMERAADFSWRNYSGAGQNGINGTAKGENSPGTLPINYSSGGVIAASSPISNNQTPTQAQPQPEPKPQLQSSPEPAVSTSTAKILISEILFDAEGSDSGKEFIELYNPSDQSADLSSWSIQHQSASGSLTKKNFEVGNAIAAKSFFLIWLGNDTRADLKWASGSLNNAGATIYLANDPNLISTTSPSGNIVDSISYDINNLPGFIAGESIERKALQNNSCTTPQGSGEYLGNGCDTDSPSDWELRAVPNPQNRQSLPEPRSGPAAVTNFQISYSSTTSELFFNWSPSPDAQTYRLTDIDNNFSVATTSLNAVMRLSEFGRNYNFQILSVDSQGNVSTSTENSVVIPTMQSLFPPLPYGIFDIVFSRDDGGNYLSFTLNDTIPDTIAIHYIIVWFNERPLEIYPEYRFFGLGTDWAWKCRSSGIIDDNHFNLRHAFESYVMPNYTFGWDKVRPPIYQPAQAPYHYKVYFNDSCPHQAIYGDRDLKGELKESDYVYVSLWMYYPPVIEMNVRDSRNYGPINFKP